MHGGDLFVQGQGLSGMIIFPYVEINGMRSLPDTVLFDLYGRMEREGNLKRIDRKGVFKNADHFVKYMKSQIVTLWTAWEGDDPILLVWAHNPYGRIGIAHFCTFGHSVERKIEAAHRVLEAMGEWFDVLIGIIAEDLRDAVHFASRVGFRKIGILPGIFDEGKLNAVITYWERRK